MGTGNILGLLLEINADPSKASEAIEKFNTQTGNALEKAAQGGKPLDDALLSNRESVRLLSEEMGVHMPRAVSGAIAKMLPEIGGLGTAVLGAFAVEEVVKFGDALGKAYQQMYDLKGATELLKTLATENLSLLEQNARKSREYALEQIRATLAQTIAEQAHHDAVQKRIEGLQEEYTIIAPLMAWILGDTKELAESDKALAEEYPRMAALTAIFREELEKMGKAHHGAAGGADTHTHALKQLRLTEGEVIHASEEAFRHWQSEAVRMEKFWKDQEEGAIRAAKAELWWALNLETFGIVGQRDISMLRELAPDVEVATASTKHLTEARRALITITEDLHRVEDAYSKALGVSNDQAEEATRAMVDNMAVFIGAIAGRKAQAEVEGGFMCAEGAFDVASGIWPPRPQLIAKGLGEIGAGIQMLEVAGKSGHHPAAAGGGGGAGYGREYERGGYGAGGGYGGGGGGTAPPEFGLAPGAQQSSGGRISVYVFSESAELGRAMAGHINTFVQEGGGMLVATRALRSTPAQG
jgi:hypothetical protein